MRNIVLLNLSDIHCMDESSQQQEIFDSFRAALKEHVNSNPMWKPDFIVVPGDIRDGKVKNVNLAYEKACEFIENIRKEFSLYPEDVIVIPGNHDRDCPRHNNALTEAEFQKVVTLFDQIQKGKKEYIKCWGGIEDQYFKSYCRYITPYFEKNGIQKSYQFIPVKSLEDYECYKTMGIKVFPGLKILFFMINTEWLVFPSFSKNRTIKVGKLFFKELVDKIHQSYQDYVVVSIMHHPPYQIDWEERNVDRMTLFNPYHMLLGVSDLIISGHDHLISSFIEPDYISNLVQHFQLGSFACEAEENRDFFLNSASLLSIDAVANEIKIRSANLCLQKSDFHWEFTNDTKSYPMRGRHGKNNIDKKDWQLRDAAINDIDIIWLKRMKVAMLGNKDAIEWQKEDMSYLYKEILCHFYYGKLPVPTDKLGFFEIDQEKIWILPLDEWKVKKNEKVLYSSPIHYIVYSEQRENNVQLQKEKRDFLLSSRILKDTLSVIILQNN